MKVLIYAQHLSGVGHRVRALELARALAERHEVALVDGGRHVVVDGVHALLESAALPFRQVVATLNDT